MKRHMRKWAMGQAVLALFASLAVICGMVAHPGAAFAASGMPRGVIASIVRADSLGSQVSVGDRLQYKVSFTNSAYSSYDSVRIQPTGGNLDGIVNGGSAGCGTVTIARGQTVTCSAAYHIVTWQDVTDGGVWPNVQMNVLKSTGAVISRGSVASGSIVTAVYQPREDGVPTTLASAGDLGVSCYRIPALAEAPNGWILAAYDARPSNCGDAPQANSIVQRISKDGGKTFENQTVVAAGYQGWQKYGYSDPSYVVDSQTGTIFLFFVKSYDRGWSNSVAGTDPNNRNVLQAAVTSSQDNGQTWSEPKVITADITNSAAWTSRFAASGHGIQLRYGKYAGRLIQQYTVRNNGVAQAVSVYSDDHGKTWHAGQPVGEGMDENKVVELSDGRVMLNSRPSKASYRKVAISEDGGQTYGAVTEDKNLPDPANNAQITRAFPNAAQGSEQAKILLYSSSSPGGRYDGIIRVSRDDGKTWSSGKLFQSGAMAYSVITALSDRAGGGYGLLYEGKNNDIMYMRISWDWLNR